jgi:2-polyprenyl-6-methoxyphenol hydroxylase-like FAD-dependent oxidoreductase
MEPVIIVGGGLGGLMLAALLEKAGLVYTVLERSTTAKMPLEGGGVIVLTTQIQPVLQQLGFLSALEDLSKPVEQITVMDHLQLHGAYHANPVLLGQINFAFARERYWGTAWI